LHFPELFVDVIESFSGRTQEEKNNNRENVIKSHFSYSNSQIIIEENVNLFSIK
jgi:hypothetical protein